MSLQIGSVHVPETVVLAPMSGVTDLPFRQQVRQFGGHLVVSEMIASEAMTLIQRHETEVRKMHGDCAAESPLTPFLCPSRLKCVLVGMMTIVMRRVLRALPRTLALPC